MAIKFEETNDTKQGSKISLIKEFSEVKSLNLDDEKEKLKNTDVTDKLSYKERKLARKKEQKAKRREQQLLLKQQEGQEQEQDEVELGSKVETQGEDIEDLEALALKHIS